MIRERTLVLSSAEHRRLKAHLFPGDGKEAAAVLLCSRIQNAGVKLLVQETLLVPHAECERATDYLRWSSAYLEQALERAEEHDLSLVLLHSHPGGSYDFSKLDDHSDQQVMPLLFGWQSHRGPDPIVHGSAIMIPTGEIKARFYWNEGGAQPVDLVAVYGEEIELFWSDARAGSNRPLAFTEHMTAEMRRLSFAVVGVSGTGSIVAEQLVRMGAGQVIAVDPDRVEEKNLNRILNSTVSHADEKALKVDMFASAAGAISPKTNVVSIGRTLGCRSAVQAVAEADVVFSCVDSKAGRHIADRLAQAMLQPLFDVGVVIPVSSTGKPNSPAIPKIRNICSRVDYVFPGSPTLFGRKIWTAETLSAEEMRLANPDAFDARVKEGYMPGMMEEAPSVICVNMQGASNVVLEWVARAYPYRLNGNSGFAQTISDLVSNDTESLSILAFEPGDLGLLGTGLREPLLGMPALDDTP